MYTTLHLEWSLQLDESLGDSFWYVKLQADDVVLYEDFLYSPDSTSHGYRHHVPLVELPRHEQRVRALRIAKLLGATVYESCKEPDHAQPRTELKAVYA